MKGPDHPVPSGDREIARLTIGALRLAGFEVDVASDLRTRDGAGDPLDQARLTKAADAEVARLCADFAVTAPDLWFTYHCYYKAPDLVGPRVSQRIGIPYAISEPSISIKRRDGPWAAFAHASEAALRTANALFWTTQRDFPALAETNLPGELVHLPAFVDIGDPVPPRPSHRPLRLLTVAMMRDGDKLESYRRIALALEALETHARPVGLDWSSGGDIVPDAPDVVDWRLDIHGDGPARAAVEALFQRWGDRVSFHGATEGAALRKAYENADVFLWPGVNEGVGMVYLEAQAAGLPVVAEDHPAQRDLVVAPLSRPRDPAALAEGIRMQAAEREVAGALARMEVASAHSLAAAADVLGRTLRDLMR